MTEAEVANALILSQARKVGDGDTGQSVDGVDAVELQRIHHQVESISQSGGLRYGRHSLGLSLRCRGADAVMAGLRRQVSDHLFLMESGDLRRAVSQLPQNLVGVLTQQG